MSSSSANRNFSLVIDIEEGGSSGKSSVDGVGVEEQLEETSFSFTGVWSSFTSLLQRQVNRLQELYDSWEELEGSSFEDATPDAPDVLDTLGEGFLANPRSIPRQTAQDSDDDVQDVSQPLIGVNLPLKGEY